MLIALICWLIRLLPAGTTSETLTPILTAIEYLLPKDEHIAVFGEAPEDEAMLLMLDSLGDEDTIRMVN